MISRSSDPSCSSCSGARPRGLRRGAILPEEQEAVMDFALVHPRDGCRPLLGVDEGGRGRGLRECLERVPHPEGGGPVW